MLQDRALLLIQEDKIDIDQFFTLLPQHLKEHSQSVAELSVQFYNWINEAELCYEDDLNEKDLYKGAYYHDIGLAFIPKRLLEKREDLSGAEYRVLKRHALYGGNLHERYRKEQQFSFEEDKTWRLAVEIAASHHERWDGKGYPAGLRTTATHIAARIVSIADAFDTIVRGTSYCMALPPAYAILELTENANKQFDPELITIIKKHYNELILYKQTAMYRDCQCEGLED